MATRWSAHFSAGCSGENLRSKENGVGQRKRWLTRGADALWSSLCFKFEVASECRWDPILLRTPTVPTSAYIAYHHGPIEVSNEFVTKRQVAQLLEWQTFGAECFQNLAHCGAFQQCDHHEVRDVCSPKSAESPHILKLGFPVASLFRPVFLTAGLVFFPAIRIDS